MKRALAIILALVLCVGVFATVGFAAENDTYELQTELKDGDKVVIYNASAKKALSNEATGTYYKAGADITVTDGKIVNPDDDIVWTVEVVDGGIKLKNAAGETLKITGTKNNLNTLTDETQHEVWEIKPATTKDSVYIVSTTKKGDTDYVYVEWYVNTQYGYEEFSSFYYYSNSEAVYAMELYVLKTAETPTVTEKVTVHAKVPASWSNANCYAWNDADDKGAGVWPGTAMTLKDGWYEIEVPATTPHIIINNGGKHTANLRDCATKEVWITVNDNLTTSISYTNPNTTDKTPETGDATALVAISAAMLLAATGVVAVVSNKKHF